MNRLLTISVLTIALGGCAGTPPPATDLPVTQDVFASLFPPQASDTAGEVAITSRVTLDLPKYRVRGTCAVYRSPEGAVQVEFIHTSLFGSYREDATIFITPGEISIQDNERGVYRGAEETLDHLRSHFEFDIMPCDVLVFMLLGVPSPEEIEDARYSSAGSGWQLGGFWKGRRLEIEGEAGQGPVRMRICTADGKGCYEARYRYGSPDRMRGYPERIVCERAGGTERLSMTVESVRMD